MSAEPEPSSGILGPRARGWLLFAKVLVALALYGTLGCLVTTTAETRHPSWFEDDHDHTRSVTNLAAGVMLWPFFAVVLAVDFAIPAPTAGPQPGTWDGVLPRLTPCPAPEIRYYDGGPGPRVPEPERGKGRP